jgi:aspartate/methionine/tyrosine aminotransferase
MPRHPDVSAAAHGLPSGVFSRLAHRIAALEGEVAPLHVGDTWLEPAVGARMQDLDAASEPGLHRYTNPMGHPGLTAALARRRDIDPARILVSGGATGGLCAAAGALLDPGDEVLVLAPFWPLITGVVRAARGVPVEVPFYDRLGTVSERLTPYLGPKTAALYVNTPSNPGGQVLDAQTVQALGAFARAHDLWLWSDEVYEDYAYTAPHTPVAPAAPERTFTVRSFSKAYGMAGNRCGYVVGPSDPAVMQELRKIGVHTFYSSPTASQIAATRVLEVGDGWVQSARDLYRRSGDAAAARLGVDPPQGGTFLFLDVGEHLGDGGLHDFLSVCVDHNLVLAPGTACGAEYGSFVRVCFTSAPPDVVARGIERLARILGR